MLDPADKLPPATLDWVLVANAWRARCFVRDDDNGALREVDDFVHPESRQKGLQRGEQHGGKVFKGTASTQFAPRTEGREKEHTEFARELAHHLEAAALAHRYAGVSIIATPAFLGDLRAQLGPATQKLLRSSVPLDLTPEQGAELEHRVTRALRAG